MSKRCSTLTSDARPENTKGEPGLGGSGSPFCLHPVLSEQFEEDGTGALIALALRAAAGASLSMLDQEIELFPHDFIRIRRSNYP
jgi:hypothetical protein